MVALALQQRCFRLLISVASSISATSYLIDTTWGSISISC